MTNAPTAYAVFGCQVGIDWAKVGSEAKLSRRQILSTTTDFRIIWSLLSLLRWKGLLLQSKTELKVYNRFNKFIEKIMNRVNREIKSFL